MVWTQNGDFSPQRAAEAVLADLREEAQEQMEQRLEAVIREWRGEADRRLEEALSELLATATREVMQQVSAPGAGAVSADMSGSVDGLGQAIGWVVRSALNEALAGESERVRVAETRRSQEAERTFRQSRGQTQAQLGREMASGQRNL